METKRRKCPTCWFEWLDKYNKAACPKCHGPMTDGGEVHGSRKIHTDHAHQSRFDIRRQAKQITPRTFRQMKISGTPPVSPAVVLSSSMSGGPLYDSPKTPSSLRSARRSVSSVGSSKGEKTRKRSCPTCWFKWYDTHNKAECPKCHASLPDGEKHGSRKIHTDHAHSRLGNVRRSDKKFSPRLIQTLKKNDAMNSPHLARVSLMDVESPDVPSSGSFSKRKVLSSMTKKKTPSSSKKQSKRFSFDSPHDFHHLEEESTFQQKINRNAHHHSDNSKKTEARRRLCPTCWFKWLDVYNKASCPKCHGPMPDGMSISSQSFSLFIYPPTHPYIITQVKSKDREEFIPMKFDIVLVTTDIWTECFNVLVFENNPERRRKRC